MSLFSKFKSLLPVSSRSFHAAENHFVTQNNLVKDELFDIKMKQDELFRRIEQTDNGINMNLNYKVGEVLSPTLKSISDDLDAHDSHMKMFAWDAYKNEGESIDDAKKRFFRSLPQATGGMRLLQLGCAKLLSEFDALCQKNSIPYWLNFGTLLGAVRHGGFIPWDDDVDLGILRNDLARLAELVEHDNRYRITVVYDKFVYCRQVRFWYSDVAIPCFLDLFIYDWAESDSRDKVEEHRRLRRKMIAEIEADPSLQFWRDEPYYAQENDRANAIQLQFDQCIEHARKKGLINLTESSCIIWSIDNLDDGKQRKMAFKKKSIFPTVPVQFAGMSLPAPRDYDFILRCRYNDYFELPKDINSHFQHVDHDALLDGKTSASIRAML